jgi:RNA polymerase sigma-70 factor (ECF subfamily)
MALSYLQHIGEAEELTQDVFITLFTKADSFRGNAKVSTWIYKITINKALNQIEKRKRRPTSDKQVEDYDRIDFQHPGVMLENQEKAKYLFYAIDKLVDNQKTAFLLSYIEELPRQEVADIMETTLKSVESLLQRAKANLKKHLIERYPEGI